jgi:hypothetical protein
LVGCMVWSTTASSSPGSARPSPPGRAAEPRRPR